MIGFKKAATVALLTVGLTLTGTSQASLVDRGGGLIYDDVLNVTWLQDANYAKNSGYDGDGLMDWANATTWTANLVYHDSVRNVDYSDWRLPTITLGYGYGYMADGELGVFYRIELGGYQQPLSTSHNINYNLFSNVQDHAYWTGTGYPGLSNSAYYYNFGGNGGPVGGDLGFSGDLFYAWAVRTGDVTAVPIPGAIWLFTSSVGLLTFTYRRKTQNI